MAPPRYKQEMHPLMKDSYPPPPVGVYYITSYQILEYRRAVRGLFYFLVYFSPFGRNQLRLSRVCFRVWPYPPPLPPLLIVEFVCFRAHGGRSERALRASVYALVVGEESR